MSLDSREIAELIMSVGTHAKDRPLSPIEVAERMNILLDSYGSKREVARRLGLKGTDMVNRFLALLNLPNTIRSVIGWKGPEEGEIGVDIGARISKLDDSTERDTLAKIVIQEPLNKQEVQDIVTLRNNNPTMTIEDCIETRIKIRPIKEVGYLLVFEVSAQTLEKIRKTNSGNIEKIISDVIESVIDQSEIESTRVKSNIVILVVSEIGYQQLTLVSKNSGVKKRDFLDYLISEKVG